MNRARKLTISSMGVVVAVAAFEHGLGDYLQGPVAPASRFIKSWPDSAFYASLNGEPAFTLMPTLSVSGILTMLLSFIFAAWALWFSDSRLGAAGIAILSTALFITGGGFGPPVLGMILALAALKVRSPLRWWCSDCPSNLRGALSSAWPVAAVACVGVWLTMLFGVAALAYFYELESEAFTYGVLLSAFLLLPLAIVTSWARDSHGMAVARS